jgi:recombination protein RecR
MATALARPLARLIEELGKLPGIGPKSAQRLAYHLLRTSAADAEALAAAVRSVKTDLRYCSVCFNIAEGDPCAMCAAPDRDPMLVCVVEEPLDVLAIERTGQFRGTYHVLHGAISPVNGVRPEDLRIAQLVARVRAGAVGELILATNPNLEGEATAMYIAQLLGGSGVHVTRLARGLPMGGDLEYADEMTVSRALEGRRALLERER